MTPRPLLAALALLFAGCGAHAPLPQPEPPAPSSVFSVAYREPGNVFEVLDNLSGWWKGKVDPEYREAWAARFGLGEADEARFASYKQIRKRYYPRPTDDPSADPLTTDNGLFAPRKAADRLAEAFYSAQALEQAFEGLGAFMTPDDVAQLRGFFEAYRAPCQQLLAESRGHADSARAMQRALDQAHADDFAREVARFYGVAELPRFTVLYVWWPPVEHVMASNRGAFLLMKYHPEKHREGAMRDSEIPVHELTHQISASQPDAQKQALSRAFVAGCDLRGAMPSPKMLEEPLAEAHQKLFLRVASPDRLDFTRRWYGDRWVDALAKQIYAPLAERHDARGQLDEALMGLMAEACQRVKGRGEGENENVF